MLLAQTNYVLISRLVMPIAAFLLLIIIGRHSDQLLGEYALVTTFYFVMQTLPLLGLSPFVMREVARRPGAAADYFVTIGLMALIAALAVNAVTQAALSVAPYPETVRQGVNVVGYSIFGGILAFLGEIILFSLGRARVVALTTILENGVRLAASVVVLMRSGDVEQLMWVVFATRMIALAVYGVVICRKPPQRVQLDWAILRSARPLLPVFATSAVLSLVMSRMDFFVLSLYAGVVELGHYAIALRLLEIFVLGLTAVATAVFPRMSRQYVEHRAGFVDTCRLLVLAMLALLIPLTLAAYAGADLYVRWLFTEQYPDAVLLSGLIVLLVPLAGLDVMCAAVLNAADQQSHELRALAYGGAVFAAALFLLVPSLLGVGAVIAITLAILVRVGLRLRAIAKRLGTLVSTGDLLGHALLALPSLMLVDYLADGASVPGILILGCGLMLGYPIFLILVGLFRPLHLMARVWPSRPPRPARTVAGLMDSLVCDERQRRAYLSEDGRALPRYENWGLACVILYRMSRFLYLRGWRAFARLVGRINLVLTKADIAPHLDIGPGLVVLRPAGLILCADVGAGARFDAWSLSEVLPEQGA